MNAESDPAQWTRTKAEAAAWAALLRGPQRDAAMEADLQRWVAADPLHAKAWELASDAWEGIASLPRLFPRLAPKRVRSRARFLRPIAVVAAVCAAFAAWALFFLGRTVTTAVGEQRTLTLTDGSRVELNTNTRLIVHYDRHTRTVTLTAGEAYFDVAHERRPFVVIAGSRKIIAVGTSFTVRRDVDADATTVTLIEGRVAVAPLEAANVLPPEPIPEVTVLSAGERFHLRRNARPIVDTPPVDQAIAWMRGQLIFDHTPLPEAVAEFNRYSPIRIRIRSPEAAEIRLGGLVRITDAHGFARAIADQYGLRLTAEGNELVLQTLDRSSRRSETQSTDQPPEHP